MAQVSQLDQLLFSAGKLPAHTLLHQVHYLADLLHGHTGQPQHLHNFDIASVVETHRASITMSV